MTLSVESKTYDEFKQLCDKNAIMLSRKIEIWMEEFLVEEKARELEKAKAKGGKK